MMHLADFEQLLKDAIGLDVASVGASTVERAVKERQLAVGLMDPVAYLARVRVSEAELQELVDAVIVPETWFFRDGEPFAALGRFLRDERTHPHTAGVYRLLSLPCSTGEEPYSMAMALLDAGVAPERFRIDGVDISQRALEQARRGLYGRSAFRAADLGFRDRHFESTPGGYLISRGVRDQVQFERGNLLAPQLAAGPDVAGLYDVIFCRNLLIYFDGPTQERAIAVLARLLAPKGFLFVGSSETGAFLTRDFLSAKVPMAFAFQKASAASPAPRAPAAPAQRAIPVSRAPAAMPPARAVRPAHARPRIEPRVPIPIEMADASRLADQGRFVEAAQQCEEYLFQQGPTAQAFYLLGLVRDASGNHLDADKYYRKALYLDPIHADALMHLALLMDTQGKPADAEVLRKRLRRIDVIR